MCVVTHVRLAQTSEMTTVDQGRGPAFAPFVAYIVVFHLAWIAWPFLVYPRLMAMGNGTLTYAVLNIGLRMLIWVVPVFLYLRFVDGVDPVAYLKLRHHVRRGVLVAIALTALNLAGSLARFGTPHPSLERVTWNSALGTSLLVGFIEEIPYRGFILQKLGERLDFWLANVMTSLLFLSIHLPGWVALHTLRADAAATVFALGVLFAIAFRYSGSLWAAILTHSANDFLSFVIFGH